jgi:hypothetical protein
MIITPFMMEFLYNIGFNPLIGDILSTIVCYLMVMLPNLFLVSYHKFGKLEVN